MNNHVLFGLFVAIFLSNSVEAGGGSEFWIQKHDFMDALWSENGTAISSARTADDFFFSNVFFLTAIEVDMVVSYPNMPADYLVDIYANSGAGPGEHLLTFDNPVITDSGEWNGMSEWRHISIKFDVDFVVLPEDTYWLSPYGLGNGSGLDSARWGTANYGDPVFSEGYFMSDELGFPDWIPVSQTGLVDAPTDFAMTLTGALPTPGGIAVLALAGFIKRSRKRD